LKYADGRKTPERSKASERRRLAFIRHVTAATMFVVPRHELSLQHLLVGREFDTGVLSVESFELLAPVIRE